MLEVYTMTTPVHSVCVGWVGPPALTTYTQPVTSPRSSPGVLDHGLEHLGGRHHRLSGDVCAADHVLLGQEHLRYHDVIKRGDVVPRTGGRGGGESEQQAATKTCLKSV